MLPNPQLSSDTDPVTESPSDDEGEVSAKALQPITYANSQYWNDRYAKNLDPFEWYMSWGRLQPLLAPILSGCRVCLHVGCGTSSLGADLLGVGVERVVNIDFSPAVVEHMRTRYASEPRLEWRLADIIKPTQFDDRVFDAVIDKGTMDAQLCSDVASSNIYEMFHEVARILKPRGHFIVISSGPDAIRRFFFEVETFDWRLHETIRIEKLPIKGTFYYVYIAEKNLAVDVEWGAFP
jgi:SAM-dependent methyltransferase